MMLTRTQAARELGASTSTVRRYEGNELHPIVTADGKHLFDPDEVRALAKVRSKTARLDTGELAARACELFREGKTAVDVVIALRQAFDSVLEWQQLYVKSSGSLFVPEALARKMMEEFFVEDEPFTAEGLYRLLARLTNRNLDLGRRVRALGAADGSRGSM